MRIELNNKCKLAYSLVHCSNEFIFLKHLVKFMGKYNRNTPKNQVAKDGKNPAITVVAKFILFHTQSF